MLLRSKIVPMILRRTFKNFGHKRQPIPLVTVIWQGFLTFTFIGLGLEWDKFSIFGLDNSKNRLEDVIEDVDQNKTS